MAALEAFKVAVKEKGKSDVWPEETLLAVGELDGTVAWNTPLAAWNYVLGEAGGKITPELLDQTFVVRFEGEDLQTPIPEELGGGRQVRVTDPGQMVTARKFATDNGFDIPLEQKEEEKPFFDSAEYFDEDKEG